MDLDDAASLERHNETYRIAQEAARERCELLAVWPVRVCVWCQKGVLPEPVSVKSSLSMSRPSMVTMCECGASYGGEFIRLSKVREWDWVLDRFGCEVVGSAERFEVKIDCQVWVAAGG